MSLSRAEARPSHTAFAPGARVEIRGEEWRVRKADMAEAYWYFAQRLGLGLGLGLGGKQKP